MENYQGYNLVQFSALPNYGSISPIEKHQNNLEDDPLLGEWRDNNLDDNLTD